MQITNTILQNVYIYVYTKSCKRLMNFWILRYLKFGCLVLSYGGFCLANGYGLHLWLCMLYLVGVSCKKLGVGFRLNLINRAQFYFYTIA